MKEFDYDRLYIESMQPGDLIYHYTSMEGALGILSNREIWVTRWDFLNDKMEFSLAQDICREIFSEHRVKKAIISDLIRGIDEFTYGNKKDMAEYYIFSCSMDADNQLLWNSYSEQIGVNLSFDYQEFSNIYSKCCWDGKVVYSRAEQKEFFEKTVEQLVFGEEEYGGISSWREINTLSGHEYDVFINTISPMGALYNMFFKDEYFAGEKEYRFVYSPIPRENSMTNYRIRNNAIIPYKVISVDDFRFLKGIKLGPLNNVDIAEKGIRHLTAGCGLNVDIERSKAPQRY